MVLECLERNQNIVEKLHDKQAQIESKLSCTVEKITKNQKMIIDMIEKQNQSICILEQQVQYQQTVMDGLQLHLKDCMDDMKLFNEKHLQLQQDVKDLRYREYIV